MKKEPLTKEKGQIDEITRAYLELRWFKKDGSEYNGNDAVAFDAEYKAYGKNNEPLIGKYFDEDGKEIEYTIFSASDVRSAVELMQEKGKKQFITEHFIMSKSKFLELIDDCFPVFKGKEEVKK
jgi:ubiquinone/menaquinone biosynthesis C-methylase UbiE